METKIINIGTSYHTDIYEQNIGGYCFNIEGDKTTYTEKNTSINRLTLKGIIKSIDKLSGPKETDIVVVHTTNYLVAHAINSWLSTWGKKGWKNSRNKPVVNNDLWKEYDRLSSKIKVHAVWIKKTNYNHEINTCIQLAYKEVLKVQEKAKVSFLFPKSRGLKVVKKKRKVANNTFEHIQCTYRENSLEGNYYV